MRRSVWRKSKEPHARSVLRKRKSGQPGVCSYHRLEVLIRVLVIPQSDPDLILTRCLGGSSWGPILTQELTTGCTQEGTLTGITLTAPTFIDTGGRHCDTLWDFTNIWFPCVSGGKTDKMSGFMTELQTCKIKENFRLLYVNYLYMLYSWICVFTC